MATQGKPGALPRAGVDVEGAEVSVKARGSSSAVQMVKKSLGLTFRAPKQRKQQRGRQGGNDAAADDGGVPFLGAGSGARGTGSRGALAGSGEPRRRSCWGGVRRHG